MSTPDNTKKLKVKHIKEVELARREFFKKCDLVAKAPACLFFEGKKLSAKAKILPLPLYAYAGIERGKFKQYEYEEYNSKFKYTHSVAEFVLGSPKEKVGKFLQGEPIKFYQEKFREKDSFFGKGVPSSEDPCHRMTYYPVFLNQSFRKDLLRRSQLGRMNEKSDPSKSKNYFKLKVWSDIPFLSGLCEGSAIAVACATVLGDELWRLRGRQGVRCDTELLNRLRSTHPTEASLNYCFMKVFSIANAMDFVSIGAPVFASLIGCFRPQEVITYESTFEKELGKVLENGIALKKKEKLETSEFLEIYFNFFCYANVYPKLQMAQPLFKWSYEKFSSQEKVDLSVIQRWVASYLDPGFDPVLKPTNPDIQCWQSNCGIYALLGEPEKIALCERHPETHLFGMDSNKELLLVDPKHKTSLFDVIYSSRREGWGAGGVEFLEKETPQKHVIKFDETDKEGGLYALRWPSRVNPEGEPINEKRFRSLSKKFRNYKIFIIDRGEFEKNNAVGEIYLGGKPVFKQEIKDGKKIRWIMPLEYRLLFYLLVNKNHHDKRHLYDLVEHCWPNKRDAKEIRELLRKGGDIYTERTKLYRKTIGSLSTFLNGKIDVFCRTRKTGVYGLTTWRSFCVLKVIQRE